MKRQFIFGTMLSAALAVGVAAQQPPTGAGGQSGQTSTSSPERVVRAARSRSPAVCSRPVRAASGSATTGAGSTGTAAGGFILTRRRRPDPRRAAPPAAPRAVQARPAPAHRSSGSRWSWFDQLGEQHEHRSTYRLMGGESQDLQQYVGQRVEVTGTVAGSSSTTGASGSSTGASTAGAGTGRQHRRRGRAATVPAARPRAACGHVGQALQVASVRATGGQLQSVGSPSTARRAGDFRRPDLSSSRSAVRGPRIPICLNRDIRCDPPRQGHANPRPRSPILR